MKAVLHTRYGPPEELKVAEVEKPAPTDNEVLIKINASSVTSSDCNIRNQTFTPKLFLLPIRLEFGLFRPKHQIIGFDLAGEIEAVGKNVTRFSVGDKIFGTTEPLYGAHAEYICLPEDGVLASMPENFTFQQAAALPVIANTAVHFIRDLGHVQAGQKILINGASGGIGTYAIQLAKHYGAEVTAVCSTPNLELVKSLGADHVIDYTREDFTKNGQIYDVIFDVVSNRTFSKVKGSLTPKGIYLVAIPSVAALAQTQSTAKKDGQKVKMEGAPALLENLVYIKELAESGVLIPVIDRVYPMEQIAEAFRYVETGHKKGNVIITM
jgi:NADPH:quinone reductase-like Zn-dependent oxidoreductase